uniref:Uncharacterized protein n=1 Tax=Arundo donax TaxID=35708 RepID=A0A0A9G181_ARUDO
MLEYTHTRTRARTHKGFCGAVHQCLFSFSYSLSHAQALTLALLSLTHTQTSSLTITPLILMAVFFFSAPPCRASQ